MDYQLRPYQVEGSDFLVRAKKAILADEMGTGKTIIGLDAWLKTGLVGPAILLGRRNAQGTWCTQTQKFGFQVPYIIDGTAAQRARDWADVDQYSFVTTTIESFRVDVKHGVAPKKWGIIFGDEIQKLGLLNRKTKGWETLKTAVECEYLFLLTGSPMRRGFQDLWAPLHLTDKRRWSSYWKYLSTFGHVQKNEFGAYEVFGLRDEAGLANALVPYYLRRTKKDVLPDLPPKIRDLDIVLQLTPQQRKMYDQLSNELIVELPSGEILSAPGVLAKITRLRQILCTPKLLDPEAEYGACIENLGEMFGETEDHHMVVFTPFAEASHIIAEYLITHQHIDPYKIVTLRGGIPALELQQRISRFVQERGIAICSIDYAESYELVPASWAYFCGFTWSADQNLQAEDRLHRFTTLLPVNYYYPTHEGCIDKELVLAAVDEKSNQISKVYRSTARLREYLLKCRSQ